MHSKTSGETNSITFRTLKKLMNHYYWRKIIYTGGNDPTNNLRIEWLISSEFAVYDSYLTVLVVDHLCAHFLQE